MGGLRASLVAVFTAALVLPSLYVQANSDDVKNTLSELTSNGHEPACGTVFYQAGASARSLMSWSNTYQKDVNAKLQASANNNDSAAAYACMKALQLRGQAVCAAPDSRLYQSKLQETMQSCSRLFPIGNTAAAY